MVIIDECDHPSNKLFQEDNFTAWTSMHAADSPLAMLFTTMKAHPTIFKKVFVTGVYPIAFKALGTAINFCTNISWRKTFAMTCGLIEADVAKILQDIFKDKPEKVKHYLELLKTRFNGFRFSYEYETPLIYNTNSVSDLKLACLSDSYYFCFCSCSFLGGYRLKIHK
jgi:hypothetical protein